MPPRDRQRHVTRRPPVYHRPILSHSPPALFAGIALLLLPSFAQAQGPERPFRGPPADLLDTAIENAEEIGLTPEQRTRLEQFRTEEAERAAGQAAEPRGGRGTQRTERRARLAELRATVTVEQMRELQGLVVEVGPRFRRGRAGVRDGPRRQSLRRDGPPRRQALRGGGGPRLRPDGARGGRFDRLRERPLRSRPGLRRESRGRSGIEWGGRAFPRGPFRR